MILFIGTDERVRLINQKGCEMLGYAEQEIVGRNWFEYFLPGRLRAEVRRIFRDLLSGQVREHEYTDSTILTAGGDERVVRWHNAVMRDDDGEVLGTLSSGLDVTEMRASEEALQESEARSKAILNTTVDAIVTADERGRIESFNHAAEKMFGYRTDEVVGRSLKILMPPPYRDEHDDYMRSYLETGKKKIIGTGREVVGLRKDGTRFPIDLAVSEFVVSGRRKFTGVVRDISERRRLEHEVLRISEEERERIGRDLHDGLGSLLSGTAMGVQALIQRVRRGLDLAADDLERVATMIEEGVQQAHALSRGLNPVRLEKEGLAAALNELAGNVRTVSGISCTVHVASALPSIVQPIATQIYRIVQEAVNNAVKHANASTISIELWEEDGHLNVSVRDDGIGILDIERNGGLGMHIMPYRARLIGGHFQMDSAPDGGTTITCIAPLTRSAVAKRIQTI